MAQVRVRKCLFNKWNNVPMPWPNAWDPRVSASSWDGESHWWLRLNFQLAQKNGNSDLDSSWFKEIFRICLIILNCRWDSYLWNMISLRLGNRGTPRSTCWGPTTSGQAWMAAAFLYILLHLQRQAGLLPLPRPENHQGRFSSVLAFCWVSQSRQGLHSIQTYALRTFTLQAQTLLLYSSG